MYEASYRRQSTRFGITLQIYLDTPEGLAIPRGSRAPGGRPLAGEIDMKRFAVLALAIAVAGGCSSTEKQPAPSPAPVQTAAANTSNVQQAGAIVPRKTTGTTGTGSYMISGPRPATGGSDCNH